MGIRDVLVVCLCGAFCIQAGPAVADETASVLKKLSLEELTNLEVTSVSKTPESLGGAAAAVAVVTNEDIRRSGATSVPDALRLLPGIHVARNSANAWAISARGFSSVNSEKLLVLSDTRSIYTPLYSGVFWDAQDYLLQDIDRIEVIRGPGAALWGSNAVNGVINITTKKAQDTQGAYLEAGAGTEERAFAAAHYGAQTAGGIYYRVFAQYFDRDATYNTTPVTSDDWRMGHAGFRADWNASDIDSFTLQGDLYRGNVGQLTPSIRVGARPGPQGNLEIDTDGGNVLGRWRRKLGADEEMQLRIYYDHTHRDDPSFTDTLDTVDLDFQHDFAATAAQEILWGVNYRFTRNRNEGKGIFVLEPSSSNDRLISGFIQDQIALGEAVRLTLGSKFEDNDFSGFEIQPSARIAWDLLPQQTLWAAISRAVRVPTRLERDIAIDVNPVAASTLRLLGNDDFEAEELLAYELGYRWQAMKSLSIDIAAFHNDYEGLASLELGVPFTEGSRTITPVVNQNFTDGQAQGVETLVTYAPLASWRLTGSYSYLDLTLDPRGLDLNGGRYLEGATPRHQFGVRSFLDLPGGFQFDAQYRNVSAIRSLPSNITGAGLSRYSELDMRLAWRGWKQLEISLVGQNLLHEHHVEFGAPAARGEVERSVYGKIAWDF